MRATRGNSSAGAGLGEVQPPTNRAAGPSAEAPPPPVPLPEPAHTRGAAQAEERSLELAALAQLLAALTPVDAAGRSLVHHVGSDPLGAPRAGGVKGAERAAMRHSSARCASM